MSSYKQPVPCQSIIRGPWRRRQLTTLAFLSRQPVLPRKLNFSHLSYSICIRVLRMELENLKVQRRIKKQEMDHASSGNQTLLMKAQSPVRLDRKASLVQAKDQAYKRAWLPAHSDIVSSFHRTMPHRSKFQLALKIISTWQLAVESCKMSNSFLNKRLVVLPFGNCNCPSWEARAFLVQSDSWLGHPFFEVSAQSVGKNLPRSEI